MTQNTNMKNIRKIEVTEAEFKKAFKRVKFGKLPAGYTYGDCPEGAILVDGKDVGDWSPETYDENTCGLSAVYRVHGYGYVIHLGGEVWGTGTDGDAASVTRTGYSWKASRGNYGGTWHAARTVENAQTCRARLRRKVAVLLVQIEKAAAEKAAKAQGAADVLAQDLEAYEGAVEALYSRPIRDDERASFSGMGNDTRFDLLADLNEAILVVAKAAAEAEDATDAAVREALREAEHPQTAAQIAKTLVTDSGTVQASLERLLEEGALETFLPPSEISYLTHEASSRIREERSGLSDTAMAWMGSRWKTGEGAEEERKEAAEAAANARKEFAEAYGEEAEAYEAEEERKEAADRDYEAQAAEDYEAQAAEDDEQAAYDEAYEARTSSPGGESSDERTDQERAEDEAYDRATADRAAERDEEARSARATADLRAQLEEAGHEVEGLDAGDLRDYAAAVEFSAPEEGTCDCGGSGLEVVDYDSGCVLGLCEVCIAYALANGSRELPRDGAGRRVFTEEAEEVPA